MAENHAEALLEILRVRFKPLRQIVGADLSEARRHAEALIAQLAHAVAEAGPCNELERLLAVDRAEQAEARAQELQARVDALTLEVARLQTDASAVHASAITARRALSEVEERAANAALPWRRRDGGIGETRRGS